MKPENQETGAQLIYKNTMEGCFVQRINRFVADVAIEGRVERVHVKNTGRMRELLQPWTRVTLQRQLSENRATAYDLISVCKPGLGWVNIDSIAPNALMKQYYTSLGFDVVRPEFSHGDSRFDFYLERGGQRILSEVKGCTLAAPDGVTGLFPDAPTVRGVRHLRELVEAVGQGYQCTLVFVVQMTGISKVMPNDAAHPEFGQALKEAARAGVRILCQSCQVEADRLRITGTTDETDLFL